jgi:UDP-glucose 4-epimerase
MKVLVTGGAGFIGSHLAEYLSRSHSVVILDDLSGGSQHNISHFDCQFVPGSILDHQLVNRVFDEHRFDYVYHLGSYAAENLSHFIKRYNYMVNVVGSVNLLNAAINYKSKCFVFTSSIAAYGSVQTPFREDQHPQPEDSYGIAKLAIERELEITRKMFGLDYVIFRLHNVIGSRQNLRDPYRNVAAIFMSQLMRGEPMTIFGDGTHRRAFTPVRDIIPAIARSPFIDVALNRTFNLGSDRHITVASLAELIAFVLKCPLDICYLPARREVSQAFSDHSLARATFGELLGDTPLSVALREMADWVRANWARLMQQPLTRFDEIEIEKGLPEVWERQ